MALVCVMSAKGAPGATTTAMLLASLWPRPSLLVDADPSGGDVALRLPREDGRALDRERGMLSLLPSARRGLVPELVHQHAQTALGGQPVLAGLAGPEQSAAVGALWRPLAEAFATLPGMDVIVDAGQMHSQSAQLPLLQRADAALWVYRPTAWSVLHTRLRLEGLADQLGDAATRVGIVAVATAAQQPDWTAGSDTICEEQAWVRSYGAVAHDSRAVVMFEGGEVFRPERTLLARSGRAVAERLYADLADVRAEPLAPEPADGTDATTDETTDATTQTAPPARPAKRRRRLLGKGTA